MGKVFSKSKVYHHDVFIDEKIKTLIVKYNYMYEKLNEITDKLEQIDSKIDVKLYRRSSTGTLVPI